MTRCVRRRGRQRLPGAPMLRDAQWLTRVLLHGVALHQPTVCATWAHTWIGMFTQLGWGSLEYGTLPAAGISSFLHSLVKCTMTTQNRSNLDKTRRRDTPHFFITWFLTMTSALDGFLVFDDGERRDVLLRRQEWRGGAAVAS